MFYSGISYMVPLYSSFVDGIGVGTAVCWFLGAVTDSFWWVRSTDLILYPVQGPSWIFISSQDFL